jgi:hypothetical protein
VECHCESEQHTQASQPLGLSALSVAAHPPAEAARQSLEAPTLETAFASLPCEMSALSVPTLASLPDEMSAASVAADLPAAADEECLEGPMQETDLASLPIEILSLVHSRLLQVDPSLRSCLALEATCKHLRSTLHSSTRYKAVSVEAGQLATAQGGVSFCRWIAAHGRRTDRLVFQNLELHHSMPPLCSYAGVLQVGAVAVDADTMSTLEPLRGLLNLASVLNHRIAHRASGGASLEPLAGLPALVSAHIGSDTTSLAPLGGMTALTTLGIYNRAIPHLNELTSLTTGLKGLNLMAFPAVTSVAPLSCLTGLTGLWLGGFPSLESVAPLHALSRLQHLALDIYSSRSISLQPLCQLTSLTALTLEGRRPNKVTDYDLQPLSALSRTLRVLDLKDCMLRNLRAIGSLGTTLKLLNLRDCECRESELQLALMFTQLPSLMFLDTSGIPAARLDTVAQYLDHHFEKLGVCDANSVISPAALTALTTVLRAIGLERCKHISSVESLTATTGLHSLHLVSSPHPTGSSSPFTAVLTV